MNLIGNALLDSGVSTSEWRTCKFSSGDLFWRKKQKAIKVLSAGDYIDKDFAAKFSRVESEIILESFIDNFFVNRITTLINELSKIKLIEEKITIRQEIIKLLKIYLWETSEKEFSLVNLVKVGEISFFKLPDDIMQRINRVSVDLLKRSAVSATGIALMAIILGQLDYDFLKELYNYEFLTNVFFDSENLSSRVVDFLENERIELLKSHNESFTEVKETNESLSLEYDGLKLKAVQRRLTQEEYSLISEYVKTTGDSIKNKYAQYFSLNDFSKLFSIKFERPDGSGFIKGLSCYELSELEQIIIMLNGVMPYKEINFTKNDGQAFFKKLLLYKNFSCFNVLQIIRDSFL